MISAHLPWECEHCRPTNSEECVCDGNSFGESHGVPFAQCGIINRNYVRFDSLANSLFASIFSHMRHMRCHFGPYDGPLSRQLLAAWIKAELISVCRKSISSELLLSFCWTFLVRSKCVRRDLRSLSIFIFHFWAQTISEKFERLFPFGILKPRITSASWRFVWPYGA